MGLFMRKESVLSSRISGTSATLSELLLSDIDEMTCDVASYVAAFETGLARINDLPIGTRLMRELHRALLNDGRLQNEIGELETFIHSSADLPTLVRLALIHDQFEAIRPFHDGNGRIGRLLVSLLLITEGLLDQPLLCLSAYFERHRDRYDRALRRVSTDGAWREWVAYFLEAVRAQSRDAIRSVRALLQLRDAYHERVRGELAHKLIDELFIAPATSVSCVMKLLDITHRAAQQNVEKLIAAKIVREVTGRRRYRIFLAEEIIRAIEA